MPEFENRIICGDCIEILSKVQRPFADLIFADPPFNIGYKYDKYHDKLKKNSYIAWTRDWMTACKKVLKPHGSFYIAIGDEYAANVKVIADEMGLFMRNWIIWHYTFGQQTRNKFARAHTHIFYFVNDKNNFVFNDHAVRVPSDRQLIYNDRRANPAGKMPDDVWNCFSRVCGTFKERQGWHPCQMPEGLLARIIAASSRPGDCVLDPFSGSGTTAAAAIQLGRSYLGIEISEEYVKYSRERLDAIKDKCASHRGNLLLGPIEVRELRRLVADVNIPAERILADRKLARLFSRLLAVRTNNGARYSPKQIVSALGDLVG